ncbi:helix-turn-helix transcriptional regulator [Pseudoteredinibacter isoporae]|uniref:DNA-binding CsgD family transcriptional regulator n=1 Tax=Pseudoteredinibacter isoporae TaxID=570281 RepID=A0A7X0JQA7_9GAMM|nr:LuxR C-terminal-related transcriptional regulator [Pseudoteredinibacter isoporae]MBB6520222.1 DNA-binding CsgD family transcriptional regulator [Pseudoteredinibacter isoporae]NHO85794.1 hypothetical protein [Pseudoteredinibacter isoporae]NIB25754.1 hypothetical protein [Pseudoteredinibacter isoporae]
MNELSPDWERDIKSRFFDRVDTLLEAIGKASFPQVLIHNLSDFLPLDHLSLVHLEERNDVTYGFSASRGVEPMRRELQQLYLSIFYRLDPNREFLDHYLADTEIQIRRLLPEAIEDRDYKNLWCEKMGINDRLSVITRADRGLYCLNLFRTEINFSDQDVKVLELLKPLLSALVLKHSRLSGTLSSFMTREEQINNLADRLAYIDSSLTQREKQVCARLLLGMSTEGIALDLDIKKQSVMTYRRRAYSRLEISSQNELFGLCLTHA